MNPADADVNGLRSRLEGLLGRPIQEGPNSHDPHVLQWAIEEEERQLAEEGTRQETWRAWHLARVPARYRSAMLTVPEVESWVKDVVERPAGPPERDSLCLVGPTGTGKTYTLWAAYKALVHAQVGPAVVNLIEFLDRMRPGTEDDSRDLVKQASKTALLMVDDLGMHKSSDWADERLYLILNRRYEEMIPGLYTTNYPVGKWAEVFGDRLASRLIEDCRIVTMSGEDRRRKGRQR